jgi:hypothetical protein
MLGAKGPDFLFCMPDRTNSILLLSVANGTHRKRPSDSVPRPSVMQMSAELTLEWVTTTRLAAPASAASRMRAYAPAARRHIVLSGSAPGDASLAAICETQIGKHGRWIHTEGAHAAYEHDRQTLQVDRQPRARTPPPRMTGKHGRWTDRHSPPSPAAPRRPAGQRYQQTDRQTVRPA